MAVAQRTSRFLIGLVRRTFKQTLDRWDRTCKGCPLRGRKRYVDPAQLSPLRGQKHYVQQDQKIWTSSAPCGVRNTMYNKTKRSGPAQVVSTHYNVPDSITESIFFHSLIMGTQKLGSISRAMHYKIDPLTHPPSPPPQSLCLPITNHSPIS
jgi:hypothetical protein